MSDLTALLKKSQRLADLGNKITKAVTDEQSRLGLVGTGGSRESFQVRITQDGIEVSGVEYYKFLGDRGPGGWPNVQSLREWLQVKGIELKALFPIGQKIATEGTDVHQGKREGLNVVQIIEGELKEFQKKYADDLESAVADNLVKQFNRVR